MKKTKIQTRDAKQLEIDPNTILSFPLGFPGFEESKRFKLFQPEEHKDMDADASRPVYWLQSLDEPDVVFSVADPAKWGVHYEMLLNDDEIKLLGLAKSGKEARISILVVLARISDDETKQNHFFQLTGSKVQPNLDAPVILSVKNRLGFQKILDKVHYSLTVRALQ